MRVRKGILVLALLLDNRHHSSPLMGEKADVCKTTSVKYDTPKTSVIYLLPDYGLAWREADLTLESEINVQ
jgi:hypothetical protein